MVYKHLYDLLGAVGSSTHVASVCHLVGSTNYGMKQVTLHLLHIYYDPTDNQIFFTTSSLYYYYYCCWQWILSVCVLSLNHVHSNSSLGLVVPRKWD